MQSPEAKVNHLGVRLAGMSMACAQPTIDGLKPAVDPNIHYIEWMTLPVDSADLVLVQQVIEDSKRAPVAYVGATWCGSCKLYKATLESETMKKTHGGVQIVEFDLDQHRQLLAKMNIRPAGVPHWEALNGFGLSSGSHIDGRAWTADTEAEMAPVLQRFFDSLDGT